MFRASEHTISHNNINNNHYDNYTTFSKFESESRCGYSEKNNLLTKKYFHLMRAGAKPTLTFRGALDLNDYSLCTGIQGFIQFVQGFKRTGIPYTVYKYMKNIIVYLCHAFCINHIINGFWLGHIKKLLV